MAIRLRRNNESYSLNPNAFTVLPVARYEVMNGLSEQEFEDGVRDLKKIEQQELERKFGKPAKPKDDEVEEPEEVLA